MTSLIDITDLTATIADIGTLLGNIADIEIWKGKTFHNVESPILPI